MHRIGSLAGIARAQLEHGAYRDRENHIGRVLSDDGGQCPARRADDIADGDGCLADLAIDRRRNRRVAQVDMGDFEIGFGGQQLALRLPWLALAESTVDCWPADSAEQRLARCSIISAFTQLRLRLVDRPLLSLHIGLEGRTCSRR